MDAESLGLNGKAGHERTFPQTGRAARNVDTGVGREPEELSESRAEEARQLRAERHAGQPMKVFVCLLLLAGCAAAQQRTRFQIFAQLVDLPETGSSQPAMIEGENLEITDRWSLRNENLTASNGQGYFGGLSYQVDIHKLLEKTKWNPEEFEFYLTGSLGKVFSERDFVNHSGFGGMFGGGFSYLPTHTEGLEIQIFELRLARLPGLHGGLAAVFSSGIQVGF